MKIDWNADNTGVVTVAASENIGLNLYVKNREGRDICLTRYSDDNVDVAFGHALTYNNLKGEEQVFVFFQDWKKESPRVSE